MPKLRRLFTLFLIIWSMSVSAQLSTGGTFGVFYTNNIFQIDVAPEINYHFTERYVVGFSPFLLYSKNTLQNIQAYIFGSRIYGNYVLFPSLFLHMEYEYSKMWTNEGFGKTIHAAPIGLGYENEISQNAVAYLLVLFDVLYNPDISIRQNPIIRAGVRYKF